MFLRVGQNGSAVDNLSAGGIQICFDKSGKSVLAYCWAKKTLIKKHPDTGVPLLGMRIEGFDDALTLAIRASNEFCVFGTIGWDIAFSVEGPVIIEGNHSWGCEESQTVTGEPLLTPAIAEHLTPHYFWSRWNKERMAPGLRGKI